MKYIHIAAAIRTLGVMFFPIGINPLRQLDFLSGRKSIIFLSHIEIIIKLLSSYYRENRLLYHGMRFSTHNYGVGDLEVYTV